MVSCPIYFSDNVLLTVKIFLDFFFFFIRFLLRRRVPSASTVHNDACVLFAERRRQTGVPERQGIAAHHRRSCDGHFHHRPVADRVLPVLLPAPARSDIRRRPSTEKVARQRVFQRRRAQQQSQSRHVAGVRAVRTAKEPVGRRQPGTEAAPAVRIVADRHRNDRAQEKSTGRDVRKRLVYISNYFGFFIIRIMKNKYCTRHAGGSRAKRFIFRFYCSRRRRRRRRPPASVSAVVLRCVTSSRPFPRALGGEGDEARSRNELPGLKLRNWYSTTTAK